MTDARSQPTTEHTPTPWRVADGEIWSSREDGSPDLILFEPAGWRHWMESRNLSQGTLAANAAFIVEAVNNYASLRAKVDELTAALRKIHDYPSSFPSIMEIARAALAVNSQHSDGEAGR